MKRIANIVMALFLILVLTACGADNPDDSGNKDQAQSIGEQLDYKIIGIDPGAGIMKITKNKVLPEYGLDDKWKVVSGSGVAMTSTLTRAIKAEKPVIVTGWTPHWKFSKFDLKYLKDPKGVYGKAENINTIARKNLKKDKPNAYKFLDQFKWGPKNLQSVMVMIEDGMKPEEAAKKWVNENKKLVNKWTQGVKSVDNGQIDMLYVAWSDVIASTNVVKHVLESKGYQVNLTQVNAASMWAGIAGGDADVMVGAWLPTTHGSYYSKYKGQFDDLGVNLHGTKIGLVVPSYMNIDSIEDLKE